MYSDSYAYLDTVMSRPSIGYVWCHWTHRVCFIINFDYTHGLWPTACTWVDTTLVILFDCGFQMINWSLVSIFTPILYAYHRHRSLSTLHLASIYHKEAPTALRSFLFKNKPQATYARMAIMTVCAEIVHGCVLNTLANKHLVAF